MGQQHTIGKTATTVAVGSDGFTRVTYHNTVVVEFNDTTVTLRTGGWRTVTTKTRMNQTANQFRLGFAVYQKRGDWFVDVGGKTLAFDGDWINFTRSEG